MAMLPVPELPATIKVLDTDTLNQVCANTPGKPCDADEELWYGDFLGASTIADVEQAEAMCAGCPVIPYCLALALRVPLGRYSVWGGTIPAQREIMAGVR